METKGVAMFKVIHTKVMNILCKLCLHACANLLSTPKFAGVDTLITTEVAMAISEANEMLNGNWN